MCGITGWIDWERNLGCAEVAAIVERMADTLNHRGPDMRGQWQSERAVLAHRRLAVIDPQSKPQPLIYAEGDRSYVITFGGEIYNFRALRRELEERGHYFQTWTDTEVILHAYVEWGEDCVRRLNGIFAIAIWDDARRQLLLARDHMGVKPLFYAQPGSAFLFGSEIKALLAHPLVKPDVDREGLADIFSYHGCRVPGRAVYRDIHEVRPGHMLAVTQERCQSICYWSLRSAPHTDDLETTGERVRFLLEQAVTDQLVSDVPLATLLSGGVDSSTVTTIASRAFQHQSQTLHAFTIDYAESARYFHGDVLRSSLDTPWAERVSAYSGVQQHTIVIDTPDLLENLLVPLRGSDLPTGGQIETSLYLLCKALKQDATVVLSGEASDELLGSYAWFHQPEAVNAPTFPWIVTLTETQQGNTFLLDWLSPEARADLQILDSLSRRYQAALAEVPALEGEDAYDARMREIFHLGITHFLPILLDRNDRMSMAAGVESRVPFCDYRFVEYIWNIPWQMKMVDGIEKGILRRAVSGLLPDDVRLRRKSAYPISYSPSYMDALRCLVLDMLGNANAPILPFLNTTVVRRFVADQSNTLPFLTLYEYWLQINAWLEDYRVNIK